MDREELKSYIREWVYRVVSIYVGDDSLPFVEDLDEKERWANARLKELNEIWKERGISKEQIRELMKTVIEFQMEAVEGKRAISMQEQYVILVDVLDRLEKMNIINRWFGVNVNQEAP